MSEVKRSLRSLIVARLIVITTLLVSSVVIQLSTASFLPLGPFYLVIITAYVLSLAYLLLYRRGRRLKEQALVQIVFDLLLVTALVYITGGMTGGLFVLYVFPIMAASLLLAPRLAYGAASIAAIFLGVLVDGMYYGIIPFFRPDQADHLSLGAVLFTIFLSWALFFAVAALMNRLGRRLEEARAALDEAQRQLAAKERLAAAGQASAMIAHEIRNPLAAIAGSIQVLKGGLRLTPEQAGLMDIVLKESRRVSETIEQFLNLAAPGPAAPALFRVADVILETLALLKMSGELNGTVRIGGGFEGSSASLRGNPGRFRQLFWNLARNALRAMPEGGTLAFDVADVPRRGIEIRVADTGLGMTDEQKRRAFEPLFTSFEGGRGLGLAVVRAIVDEHEGRIRMESRPGEGTTVVLTFPAEARAPAAP